MKILFRSWTGYLGAQALSRLFSDNPLTRHDGPLSVRKAYTRGEMADLARAAGLGQPTFDVGPFGYRVAMTAGPRR